MTITIKIDDLPVELRVVHYLPPEPPIGLCGYGFAAVETKPKKLCG